MKAIVHDGRGKLADTYSICVLSKPVRSENPSSIGKDEKRLKNLGRMHDCQTGCLLSQAHRPPEPFGSCSITSSIEQTSPLPRAADRRIHSVYPPEQTSLASRPSLRRVPTKRNLSRTAHRSGINGRERNRVLSIDHIHPAPRSAPGDGNTLPIARRLLLRARDARQASRQRAQPRELSP